MNKRDCRNVGLATRLCRIRDCSGYATHIDGLCRAHAERKYPADYLRKMGPPLLAPTDYERSTFDFPLVRAG